MKQLKDNRFGTVEALKKIGISSERLRYWEKAGIVSPIYIKCGTRKFRRYSKEDIFRCTLVKMLVDDDKYTLEGAIRKLKEKSGA
jgi:DNA-binding transcriptional MerR regulator